jgi:hypothetical protein
MPARARSKELKVDNPNLSSWIERLVAFVQIGCIHETSGAVFERSSSAVNMSE